MTADDTGTAATAFAEHDHRACRERALRAAERHAARAGLRLTPVRRRALEILLEQHRAVGAYEVLDRLAEDGFGRQPPVAYRALEFLVENGFAHRIRRTNGFAACTCPGRAHAPLFLVCRDCSSVAEVPAAELGAALSSAAAGLGFAVEGASLEATGRCPACARSAAT